MFVHAFKKGVLLGPFSESLIRSHPATFAEIRGRAVAHIATESEVTEKRGNVASTKPRAQARVQPQRVMEEAVGKRDQRTRHPYDPKKNKSKGPGRPREGNRPPRYEFVMGLADLIAIPNIAARLKVPEKTTEKILGQSQTHGASSTRVLATLSTRVWLWDTSSSSWSNVVS